MKTHHPVGLTTILLVSSLLCNAAAEEPIATIAVISNPYITTLPAEQIKDENGSLRDFLAQTGPASMQKTVELVNKIQPDALVVLGSLTWSGSDDDHRALNKYLDRITVPMWVVGGHRDGLNGLPDRRKRLLGQRDATNLVKRVPSVRGVRLAFSNDLHADPDTATRRLEQQLQDDGDRSTVLLFAARDRTMGRSRLSEDHQMFWSLVDRHKIAVRFEPTRYGHRLGYENTLPLWTVGSTAWSTRGAITLVQVFADRIEMAEVGDASRRDFSLSVPNPTGAARMTRLADAPYGSPSHSRALAQKPDFTFALVSDPQFDRQTNRDYLIKKAEAAIIELNQLKPAMVFVAGDLVNNNLPEEWEIFNRVFAKLEPPRHVVPGNHDVLFNYDFVEKSYATAGEKNPEYAALVAKALAAAKGDGFGGPAALYEKYTGSRPRQLIEFRNCAFITVPFLTTRADTDQIDFLERQLVASRNKRHVFVVAHYPSLPVFGNNLQPQLGGTRVLTLLQQHRVTGYLFGHRHRNGFRMHERTAHVLTDNMSTIHLLHVFPDRILVGRKHVGSALYETLTIPSPRK
jgi:Icc-related predicted phosphoesterase